MSQVIFTESTLEQFEQRLRELRPSLHRYCSRMTGSVIDGEDVLQMSMIRAFEALSRGDQVKNLDSWMFQIAHNTSVDFLRSLKKKSAMQKEQHRLVEEPQETTLPEWIYDDLKSLLYLPPLQRSVLILTAFFGHTADEVADLIDSSASAVKSALHRGREKIKTIHPSASPTKGTVSSEDRQRLALYANLFNDRNFDQLRSMLTAEVQLDLVDKSRRQGKERVGEYFSNYAGKHDWFMVPGTIEGRPAILAFETDDTLAPPGYFLLLKYREQSLTFIRDFRYARYVMEAAEWQIL